jgi:peptide/nickel transport system substrate-binding protein
MIRMHRFLSTFSVCAAALIAAPTVAQTTLRIVPQANPASLDPVWTTAHVTRNHGYMIYDTLFGTDAKGDIKPQMVDKWSTSADQLTWTFTLRDGLEFHDGKPVTSADVIASLTRWSARDAMGVVFRGFFSKFEEVDAKTFRIVYRQPFGLTLEMLGKAGGPAFIMPKSVAETAVSAQIKEHIGSGPYIFKADEFKPGERIVYVKNTKYVSRKETPSGTAGGKPVFTDRVEWVIIRDAQAQLVALRAGEVDIIEQPAPEQYAALRTSPGISLFESTPAGGMYTLRFNFLNPPFDNVLIRRAAMLALGQEQVLKTQVAAPGMYRFCKSLYPCGTRYESQNTGIFTGVSDPAAAKKLLDEAGYKGQPILLMRPSDFASLSKAPLVVKQQLEAAGFTVDMQTMEWQALLARRAKKEPASAGGWDAFITFNASTDNLLPLTMSMMNASGSRGWFGWQNDTELEEIKKQFASAKTDAEKKKLADQAQLRAIETVTHVNLGQFNQPAAVRSNVSGIVPAGAHVYWNIKKGS